MVVLAAGVLGLSVAGAVAYTAGLPLQDVVTLSSDRPVEISCNSTADAVAGNATITAIRVGAVHG